MTRHHDPGATRVVTLSAGMIGSLEALTRCLIRHGAHSAPPSLSERLEEEWLADLAGRASSLSRLGFALGCCWASRVIAHELAGAVRAAPSATGPKSVTLYAQPDPSLLSPRAAVFLLILCLHTVVIYGLAAGLARRVLEEIPPTIGISFPEQPANRVQPPPPPPRPDLVRPKIEKVDALITIDTPPDINAIRDPIPTTPEHPLAPVSTGPVDRIVGGPGAGFPITEDYYPAASKRMGEKGVATVRVCVDAAGRLTTDPSIVQPSGSARLDEGALRLARAGSGHYRATTEDGRPVSSCYAYRIRFELRD
jgi:periplasmic protein TonB